MKRRIKKFCVGGKKGDFKKVDWVNLQNIPILVYRLLKLRLNSALSVGVFQITLTSLPILCKGVVVSLPFGHLGIIISPEDGTIINNIAGSVHKCIPKHVQTMVDMWVRFL